MFLINPLAIPNIECPVTTLNQLAETGLMLLKGEGQDIISNSKIFHRTRAIAEKAERAMAFLNANVG